MHDISPKIIIAYDKKQTELKIYDRMRLEQYGGFLWRNYMPKQKNTLIV